MLDFAAQYWLQVAFGAISSILAVAVRYLWQTIKKEHDEQRLLREAVLAILHDRLYSLARYYLAQGWLTIQDLDNLEYIYKAYHGLGGNGTGTDLFTRCKALPIRPLNVAGALNQKEE